MLKKKIQWKFHLLIFLVTSKTGGELVKHLLKFLKANSVGHSSNEKVILDVTLLSRKNLSVLAQYPLVSNKEKLFQKSVLTLKIKASLK